MSNPDEVFPVYDNISIEMIMDDCRSLVFNNDELVTKRKLIKSLIRNASMVEGAIYNKEKTGHINELSVVLPTLAIDAYFTLMHDRGALVRYVSLCIMFDNLVMKYYSSAKQYNGIDKFGFYEIDCSIRDEIIERAKSKKYGFIYDVTCSPSRFVRIKGSDYRKKCISSRIKSAR